MTVNATGEPGVNKSRENEANITAHSGGKAIKFTKFLFNDRINLGCQREKRRQAVSNENNYFGQEAVFKGGS